jgi:stage V sporulation protein G
VEITEIRIKIMDDRESRNERLLAFCSVTFDNMFVVRDLKVIEGTKGSFVAMPSRKLTDRCPGCGCKNHLRSRYCNQCGGRLNEERAVRDMDGRAKLHADVAHPINSAAREFIQGAILRSFQEELVRSKQPGYVCRYDEIDAGEVGGYEFAEAPGTAARAGETFRRDPAHAPRPTPAARQGMAVPSKPVPSGGSFGANVFE